MKSTTDFPHTVDQAVAVHAVFDEQRLISLDINRIGQLAVRLRYQFAQPDPLHHLQHFAFADLLSGHVTLPKIVSTPAVNHTGSHRPTAYRPV